MAILLFIYILYLFFYGCTGFGSIMEYAEVSDEMNNGNLSYNEIDEIKETLPITFRVYNRENPEGNVITVSNPVSTLKSAFNQNIPAVFITHGWLASENFSSVENLKEAFLKTKNMNVITVSWSRIARNGYLFVTSRVLDVGNMIGKLITRLLDVGVVSLEGIHLVGHSLGAHVMGNAGGLIRDTGYGKVARITGLDAAGPLYENFRNEDSRLDEGDGQFVDTIHTSTIFGYTSPLGHADFYPNGGLDPQPGCFPGLGVICSHIRAWRYFEESIYNEGAFPAVKCDSYINYILNRCQNGEIAYMGYPTAPRTRGKFYLRTNGAKPYGRGTI